MNEKPGKIPWEVTRRGFLKTLGAAGIGVAAASAVESIVGAAPTAATDSETHQWAFVIDLRKCDGCEECTKACQATHALAKDQRWINVYKIKNSTGTEFFMPRLCMQCENPPCLRVCPTGATYAGRDGVVLVDQNLCIGCRTCMAACPYEARYFNWKEPPTPLKPVAQTMPEFPVPQKKGTVGKCILCVHYANQGKLPACVDACSMEALYIGDMTTDVATNGHETVKLSKFLRDNDAVHFREELGTRPRVWYIAGHGQKLDY
ncbi:MAG: 4Fe-4S dicluster domain-containing protein [Chloroflexota bacterium]|nr:MAG: 4Fe-4S dicluster domain-containing protein [Chloroflexota bacterium]